jgi:hypothetical protein
MRRPNTPWTSHSRLRSRPWSTTCLQHFNLKLRMPVSPRCPRRPRSSHRKPSPAGSLAVPHNSGRYQPSPTRLPRNAYIWGSIPQAAPVTRPSETLVPQVRPSRSVGPSSEDAPVVPRISRRRPRGCGRSGDRRGPSSSPPRHVRATAGRPWDRRWRPATSTPSCAAGRVRAAGDRAVLRVRQRRLRGVRDEAVN